jgi:hypothetical protein
MRSKRVSGWRKFDLAEWSIRNLSNGFQEVKEGELSG